ncbi:hypothetical protein ABIC65_000288 [Sphingomonas trueperi]|uniref:glycosyltransferase n=1 Tax=Sphingomonas trueperi TaxID=53317 RepID=UPI003390CEAB
MRILFATPVLPGRRRNGGELWSQTLVDSLRRNGADVTVLGYGAPYAAGEVSAGPRAVETRAAPLRALGWAVQAIGRNAFSVQKWIGPAYRRALAGQLARQPWDAVLIDHAQMGWIQPLLGGLPLLYLAHHAEAQLYMGLAEQTGALGGSIYGREARHIGAMEQALAGAAVRSWCISDADAALLAPHAGERVQALPSLPAMALQDSAVPEGVADVALLGNWRWQPNHRALSWFLSEVRPRLPRTWRVAVGGAVDRRRLPDTGGVDILGPVPDAERFLRGARRIAVPSLARTGANLKLLDAIASARTVVATREAGALVGTLPPDVILAPDAETFARALIDAPAPPMEARAKWLAARVAQLDAAVADGLSAVREQLRQRA